MRVYLVPDTMVRFQLSRMPIGPVCVQPYLMCVRVRLQFAVYWSGDHVCVASILIVHVIERRQSCITHGDDLCSVDREFVR